MKNLIANIEKWYILIGFFLHISDRQIYEMKLDKF